MKNGIYTERNFLDLDTVAKTLKICDNNRDLLWLKKDKGNELQYFFGTGINNTAFNTDSSYENYVQSVYKNNKMMMFHFDWLYKILIEKYSNFYGVKCDIRDDLFLPHIRVFESTILHECNPIGSEGGYHYDAIFNKSHLIKTQFKNIPFKAVMSSTICLESPQYTCFEWIDGTENYDYKTYTSSEFLSVKSKNANYNHSDKILTENMIKNHKIYEYTPGCAVMQWNHVLHRIGRTIYSKAGERRCTVQVNGLYDGEKIWLTC
jgi:hypothetical protein